MRNRSPVIARVLDGIRLQKFEPMQYVCIVCIIIEGSLEVFQTIWTDGKAEVGRVKEEKGSEERVCRSAKKIEKSRNIVFVSNVLCLRRLKK